MARTLWAVSDLHVTFKENQAAVDRLAPRDPGDWLIVAGDVAERIP
ncbi:metallophosphoesterase, partial [Corynebacterium stationis]